MGGWLMLYDHLAVESLVKVWWEKRHNILLCLSDLDSQTGHKKEKFYSPEGYFFVTENDAKNMTDFLQYVTLI